jgi:hypothetical protein
LRQQGFNDPGRATISWYRVDEAEAMVVGAEAGSLDVAALAELFGGLR